MFLLFQTTLFGIVLCKCLGAPMLGHWQSSGLTGYANLFPKTLLAPKFTPPNQA